MNHLVSAWWMPLADHLWQSTVFVAVVWLITFLLRKSHARLRYGLWVAASLKLLLPFSLLVALGGLLPKGTEPLSSVQTPLYATFYASGDALSQPFANFLPASGRERTITKDAWGYPVLLLLLWFAGTATVASVWWLRWKRVTGIRRRAVEAPSGREVAMLRRLNPGMSIPVLLTEEHVEPGIIGVVRPALIWPVAFSRRLDDDQMEAILKHEMFHVSRRDNLTLALHMLVEVVFWFHPMVWWIERRLIENRERACDEAVIQMGTNPEVYAESILQACRFYLDSPSPWVARITGADLSDRIHSIMSFRPRALSGAARTLLPASAFLTIALPILFGVVRTTPLYGQILHAEGPLPSFEVVTIKPWQARPLPLVAPDGTPPKIIKAVPTGDHGQSTDRVHMIGQASILIMSAYNLPVDPARWIVGGPEWVNSQANRYAIEAKIDESDFASMQKMTNAEQRKRVALMEQSLLAERFKLKVHFETREMPVYALVVAKSGPKLTAAGGNEVSKLQNTGNAIDSELTANAVTMAEFVNFPPMWPDRPIVDQTGIKGRFNFTLKWSSEEAGDKDSETLPSLFTAMQDQLGLRLVQTKGPVEVVVIDHIERPTVN